MFMLFCDYLYCVGEFITWYIYDYLIGGCLIDMYVYIYMNEKKDES